MKIHYTSRATLGTTIGHHHVQLNLFSSEPSEALPSVPVFPDDRYRRADGTFGRNQILLFAPSALEFLRHESLHRLGYTPTAGLRCRLLHFAIEQGWVTSSDDRPVAHRTAARTLRVCHRTYADAIETPLSATLKNLFMQAMKNE